MDIKTISLKQLSLLLVCALLIGSGMGYLYDKQQPDISVQKMHDMQSPPIIQGAIFPMAKNIGEFELQQSNNQIFTQEKLKNIWSLLFIGYTQCPDVCPTTLSTLKQTVSLMRQKGLTPPQVVFISIDPERDNADSLNEYVYYFDKDFIGVTGDEEELDDLAMQLAVYFRKVPGASGDINNDDYLMEHSASLMLINPQGDQQAVLTAPHKPEIIVESIRQSQAYYQASNE